MFFYKHPWCEHRLPLCKPCRVYLHSGCVVASGYSRNVLTGSHGLYRHFGCSFTVLETGLGWFWYPTKPELVNSAKYSSTHLAGSAASLMDRPVSNHQCSCTSKDIHAFSQLQGKIFFFPSNSLARLLKLLWKDRENGQPLGTPWVQSPQ